MAREIVEILRTAMAWTPRLASLTGLTLAASTAAMHLDALTRVHHVV